MHSRKVRLPLGWPMLQLLPFALLWVCSFAFNLPCLMRHLKANIMSPYLNTCKKTPTRVAPKMSTKAVMGGKLPSYQKNMLKILKDFPGVCFPFFPKQ